MLRFVELRVIGAYKSLTEIKSYFPFDNFLEKNEVFLPY